ncbi:MAG TPA: molecular chaperone DnaJ [Gaiellaceae bacterium]|nr:molecular chaperone DnaJ [Gaiellaceae bacterium]
MATTERDYYEVLGVSRGASAAEIKRAFRALARELHPDVSSAPDAEIRFREVAEAYEVLSDRDRREIYDRFGHAGLRRGGFQPHFADFGSLTDIFTAFFGEDLFGGGMAGERSARAGGDIQAVVEIDLEEAFTGLTTTVAVDIAVACERCGASGAEPGTASASCDTCGGAGVVSRVSRTIFGEFVQQRTCPACGGAGETLRAPCVDCGGDGRRITRRELEVDIPAGIDDGQRIRLRGEGHAGFRGGEAGNTFVLVRVRPDPRFVRDGMDLHTAVRIPMTDAALGATVRVSGIGGDVELDVEPGTQPGEVVRLRGQGMPFVRGSQRGDLYARLDVLVPTKLRDEQRTLLEEFGRQADDETYASRDDDGGFFQRLKSALR